MPWRSARPGCWLRRWNLRVATPAPPCATCRPIRAPGPELLLRGQALLQAATKAPQPDAAALAAQTESLQTWLALHPRDAGAWLQLAQLWQAQGVPLRAVRAEAEAHAARYDYAAAVDRFKAGQDLARRSTTAADHVEASIIDTRLRAVESLLREQAAER
jgi:predicted Zn-dependent protease